jgi:hypothetical protein
MTKREQQALAYLIELAAEAPMRRTKYVSEAKVPWRLIEDVRRFLDQVKPETGLDWRAFWGRGTFSSHRKKEAMRNIAVRDRTDATAWKGV